MLIERIDYYYLPPKSVVYVQYLLIYFIISTCNGVDGGKPF